MSYNFNDKALCLYYKIKALYIGFEIS
jgi:hypothetical protein